MNQINFNVTGSERQRLVGIIGKTLGVKARYQGMPSMAYAIGDSITVDGTGVMSWDDSTDLDTIRTVCDALVAAGFEPEGEIDLQAATTTETGHSTAVADETVDGLTISFPLEGFDAASLDRLQKLVDSKAALIKKALAAHDLTIRSEDDTLSFAWWDRLPSPEETQAYAAFLSALCRKAKEAKRVNAREREVESEKFTFRVFLMSLGLDGVENKQIRKILMERLSGSAAFPTQAAADEFAAKQKAKRAKT